MNFLKTTLFLIFLSNLAFGQWQWARTATGDTSYTAYPGIRSQTMFTDAAGNSYVIGSNMNYAASFGGVTVSKRFYFVVKYDAAGNAQWARQASGYVNGADVCADASGNVYVLGTFSGNVSFGPFALTALGTVDDMFLVKYDGNGNEQWAKSASTSGVLYPFSIASDATGDVVVAGKYGLASLTIGSIVLPAYTGNAMFLAKYNGNGNEQWARAAPGIGSSGFQNVAVNAFGDIYVGGSFDTSINIGSCATCAATAQPGTLSNIYFAKFDPAGNPLWVKAATGSGMDFINAIAVDADGGLYGTGSFSGAPLSFGGHLLPQPKQVSFFLVRYDSSGNALWARSAVNDGLLSRGLTVAVNSAGDVYLGGNYLDSLSFGSTNIFSNGLNDLFIAKYDAAGSPTWATSSGGVNDDWLNGIGIDGAGNIYAAGMFEDTSISFGSLTLHSKGYYNDFFTKYGSNGTSLWASKSGSVHFSNHTDNWAAKVVADNAGNIYVTGTFYQKIIGFGPYTLANRDTSGNSSDIFFVKYSPTGAVLSAKSIGSMGDDYGGSVAIDPQGNIYVSGSFEGIDISAGAALFAYNNSVAGTADGFLVKFDATGNMVWGKAIGGMQDDLTFGMDVDNAGNVLVTGYFSGNINIGGHVLTTGATNRAMFVAKFDPLGVAFWAQQGKSNSGSYGLDVATDGAGNCYICGSFTKDILFGSITLLNSQGVANFIVKLDEFGVFQTALMSKGFNREISNVEADDAGNLYASWSDTLVKYDPSLNIVWKRDFDQAGILNITTTPSGNTFVTGSFNTDSLVTGNNTIFKYDDQSAFAALCDAGGYIPWARGVAGWSRGNSICADQNSNVFVAGIFASTDGMVMGPDTLRSYLSSNMFIGSLGNTLSAPDVPKQTNLVTVYPNPFNQSTTFKLENAVHKATLVISDVLGRTVRQLQGLSGQTINLSRKDLPAGVYIFSLLEAGRYVGSGKLVVTD